MTNQQRLAVLNNRYERLLELNAKHNYVRMIFKNGALMPSPKAQQYLRLLLQIKKEKQAIWNENRQNPVVAENLENAKQAVIGLTRQHLYSLTKPNF